MSGNGRFCIAVVVFAAKSIEIVMWRFVWGGWVYTKQSCFLTSGDDVCMPGHHYIIYTIYLIYEAMLHSHMLPLSKPCSSCDLWILYFFRCRYCFDESFVREPDCPSPADEVIRKRLLIDGDGAGDDRRINVLLKSFTKWCTSPNAPEEGWARLFTMEMITEDDHNRETCDWLLSFPCAGLHSTRGCWAHWLSVSSRWLRRWWFTTWTFEKWRIMRRYTPT